jgi:signal transduction histidine kinase
MNSGDKSSQPLSPEALFPDLIGNNRIDALNKEAWELRTRDTERAIAMARHALYLSRKSDPPYESGEANALSHVGICLWIKEDFREALEPTLKSVSLFRKLEDSRGIARACNTLGLIYWRLDQLELALEQFHICYRLYDEMGYEDGVANSLNNIAIILTIDERMDEAEEFYHRAVAIMQKSENWMGVANAQVNLGFIYLNRKDLDEAIRWFRASLRSHRKVDNFPSIAHTLSNLASAYYEKGSHDRVKRLLILAHRSGKQSNKDWKDPQDEILWVRLIATPDFAGYNLQEAIDRALKLKQLCEQRGDEEFRIKLMEIIPDLYARNGELDKSNEAYRDFIEVQKRRFRKDADRRLKNLEIAFKVRQTEEKMAAERDQRLELTRLNTELKLLNESKNDFLRMAAHDLRTPVSGIHGLTEALLEQNESDNPQNEDLLLILQASNHMSQLIENLLDVDAIETGQTKIQLQWTDPVQVITEWISNHRILAEKKGINIRLVNTSPHSKNRIQTDPVCLSRIIANLLSNAVKFSEYNSDVILSLDINEQHFRLSIHDGGPGIPEQELNQLFRKFCKLSPRPTSGEGSSGLGLYIVKQLCNLLNGEITATNHPNGGAVFTLKLPIKRISVAA